MWISPQLHKIVYGRFQSDFHMAKRWGGYRPMVFMQSGLALSFWMVVCSLSGLWLWMSGSLKKVLNVPMSVLVPVLFATTVLCKSAGALLFMVVALGSLYWIKWFRNALPLLVLVAMPAVYMYQRINQNWSGEWMVQMVSTYMSPDRAQSLQTRLDAEDLLTAKALEAPSPAFGWGKWSPDSPKAPPWRVGMVKANGEWKDLAPTDGLWVIALGQFGLVGLTALTVTILLPCLIFWARVPLRFWDHPVAACASPLAILLAIHMSDHLLNAMINPIFMLALGGISAIGPSIRKVYRAQKLAAAQGAVAYGGGYAPAAGYASAPGSAYPAGYAGYAPTAAVRRA